MEHPQNPPDQPFTDSPQDSEDLKRALEECLFARQRAETELARTLESAQSAQEEMQHFIYAVSHDLRAPLRSVASYAKLLQRQFEGNVETSELTAFIVTGAAEMNTLIEDLLKYSRTGGSPRRTTVNLGALVQFAVMNLQPLIAETGARIQIADLPTLAVDESQLIQLFQQILSNALKFRSADSPSIRLTAEELEEGHVFSVQDNGSGIDAKYHQVIFTPFKRLQGREVPGTGLGLAMCKKIISAHGGRIWVESDGQHGSTFKFLLPY